MNLLFVSKIRKVGQKYHIPRLEYFANCFGEKFASIKKNTELKDVLGGGRIFSRVT
jgi:hypothetical protein